MLMSSKIKTVDFCFEGIALSLLMAAFLHQVRQMSPVNLFNSEGVGAALARLPERSPSQLDCKPEGTHLLICVTQLRRSFGNR